MYRTRRLILLLIPLFTAVMFIALLLSSAGAVSQTVQELNLNPSGFASDINVTGDGNLWITDYGIDELWFIDLNEGTYTTYANISSPVDAREDALGNAWWGFDISAGNQGIGRLNIKSQSVQLWPLPGGGSPSGTALDEDGRLWVTNSSDPLLFRFDLGAGELCTYTVPASGSGGSDYILHRVGLLWLADTFNEQIISFNYQSGQYKTWPLEESSLPYGLTFDDGGNIWWADSALNHLGRLNPSTDVVTTYSVPTNSLSSPLSSTKPLPLNVDPDRLDSLANAASVPIQVAARDGKIWFTDWLGERAGSLDPQTAISSTVTVTPATTDAAAPQCQAIEPSSTTSATSSTGDLQWASGSYDVVKDGDGWLIYQLPQGSTPWGLAADINNVWLTDQGRQKLGRIELRKCYLLSTAKSGAGSIPQTIPGSSLGCTYSSYIEGQEVLLSAQPSTGWRVKGWAGTEDDSSKAETNVVTMPASDHDVSVIYELIPLACYRLIFSHTGSGADPQPSINKSPGCTIGSYIPGETIGLATAPAPGWEVSGWTGTDNDKGQKLTNLVTMPSFDHSVIVHYGPGLKLFLPLMLKESGSE